MSNNSRLDAVLTVTGFDTLDEFKLWAAEATHTTPAQAEINKTTACVCVSCSLIDVCVSNYFGHENNLSG